MQSTTHLLILVIALLSTINLARGQLTAEEAASQTGKMVTIVDRIESALTNSNQVLFLNFGAPYPNNSLALVILPSLRDRFPRADQLKGQTVQVTGKIVLRNGHPRIILRDPAQLTVQTASDK